MARSAHPPTPGSAPRSGVPSTTLTQPRIITNPWIILISLAFGFFMILLDTTIVNVAIPSMIDGLHASLDQILWVLNAYVLVYAVLLITAGRLGDMFGPKRMFMSGLTLFVLASALCGIAQSSQELIAFRILQAVGGALLTPQSMSIITTIFPPEKRGGAFGLWAAVAGVAASTGPTLGGFLTTTFSWRAIFYVNLPLGVIALIMAYLVMPELRINRRHHLDVGGVLLGSFGLFALVFGLIEGDRYGWGRLLNGLNFTIGSLQGSLFSIPTVLTAGVLLLVGFVLYEARHQEGEPLLPLKLFRDRNFAGSNAVSAIVSFGMMGMFLPFTIYLQSVLKLPAENAGVVMVPMSLTSMFVAPFAGRLADRGGAGKWILAAGLLLYASGMGLVIMLASQTSQGTTFTLPLILAGIGMGMVFAPMVTLAMRNVQPTEAGAASGLINTLRQVGGAFGIAAIGATLSNQLTANLHSQALRSAGQLPAGLRSKFVASFSHTGGSIAVGRGQTGANLPTNVPAQTAHHLAAVGAQVFDQSFILAMKPALGLAIGMMIVGAAVATTMRTDRARQQARATQPEASRGVAATGE